MVQRATNRDDAPPRPPRPCTLCGAPLRFSHLAYAGRGEQRATYRCTQCGNAETTAARPGAPRSRPTSRKPLPDDGPPDNAVIDEATARLLREQFGGGA